MIAIDVYNALMSGSDHETLVANSGVGVLIDGYHVDHFHVDFDCCKLNQIDAYGNTDPTLFVSSVF